MTFFSGFKKIIGIVLVGFGLSGAIHAQEFGTAAQAEAMTKRAVAFIKANGPEKAAEEFTNGKSFKDRDLYVSYLDLNGKMLGHGVNPKLVGKDLLELKDPAGNFMVKMAIEVAKSPKASGWTGIYKFKNPTSEKLQDKVMYVELAGDAYVGVGIYK